jgi:hypothetical protein
MPMTRTAEPQIARMTRSASARGEPGCRYAGPTGCPIDVRFVQVRSNSRSCCAYEVPRSVTVLSEAVELRGRPQTPRCCFGRASRCWFAAFPTARTKSPARDRIRASRRRRPTAIVSATIRSSALADQPCAAPAGWRGAAGRPPQFGCRRAAFGRWWRSRVSSIRRAGGVLPPTATPGGHAGQPVVVCSPSGCV